MDGGNGNNGGGGSNNKKEEGNDRLGSLMMAAIPRRARPPRQESTSSLTSASLTSSAPIPRRPSTGSMENMTIPRRKPHERSGSMGTGGGGSSYHRDRDRDRDRDHHPHHQQHRRPSSSGGGGPPPKHHRDSHYSQQQPHARDHHHHHARDHSAPARQQQQYVEPPPQHQQQQKPPKKKRISIISENPFIIRIKLKNVPLNNGGIPRPPSPATTALPTVGKKRTADAMMMETIPEEQEEQEETPLQPPPPPPQPAPKPSRKAVQDDDDDAFLEEDEDDAATAKALQNQYNRTSTRTPKRIRPSYEEVNESDGLVDSSDEDDENYTAAASSKSKSKKLRKGSQAGAGSSRSSEHHGGGGSSKAAAKSTAANNSGLPLGPLSVAGTTEIFNFLDPGSGAGSAKVVNKDGQVDAPPPGMLSALWYSRECFSHVFVVDKIVGWKRRPVVSLQWQDANALKFLDPQEASSLSQKALAHVDFWNDPRKRMEVSRIAPTQCPVVTTIAAEREMAKSKEEGVTPMYTLQVSSSPEQPKEDVLLVKWRGRSYMHCSWERPTDIQKTDTANQTARHKIRRYYQSQELAFGKDWKKVIEEERATAAAIHSHGDASASEGNQGAEQGGNEEFFPAQNLEVERIVGCDENEMDMNVLAMQRAWNIRAEQEAQRVKEEAEAPKSNEETPVGDATTSSSSPSKPKTNPIIIKDLVDIHRKEEPWDPEGNVRYVVKWKGLPWADLTWEYWRDIKRDAVDEAEDFWHRQKPPAPDMIKEIVNKPHPHVRDFRKLQASSTYGISTRIRPVGKLEGEATVEEEESEPKQGFKLRAYQLEGVNWLLFNWWNKRSCILADEMGLGKTVQTLGFLQELWRNPLARVRGPFLIVAPLSLIGQWQSEARSWAPDFNVVLYHGSADAREFLAQQEFFYTEQFVPRTNAAKLMKQHVTKFNLLITTYEVVLKDIAVLSRIRWRALIVDEAHRLKNPDSRLFAELASVPRDHCVLLTGTPLANNTEELWALLHFDDPVAFGDREGFMEKFGQLNDSTQVNELHTILKPYLLRRVKEDVETSLPPKEEIILEVTLTPIQKKYYKAIYERNTAFLYKGAKPSNAPSLMNVMMELRKICNHPYLVKGVEDRILADAAANWKTQDAEGKPLPVDYVKLFGEQLVKSSGKMVLLEKLLLKLFTGGHKVLIFSQMVRVLDLLEELLKICKYRYERLDGSTSSSSRAAAVDRFNRKSCQRFVMLLSTRAGGLGLNLTSADTIVIFDSDWNPQNDLQAMARAHRIGQTRKVQIFRLLTAKTYEMHMFHSASMKLGLERAVLAQQRDQNDETEESAKKPKNEKEAHAKEIDELLKKGAYDIFRDEDDAEAEKFMSTDIDSLLERSSKKVTYGAGSTASLGSGLGSFSKASFVTDTGDGEKDVDLDDPDFWAKAVGLDAPVETPEEVAQMIDDGIKRNRKQVQQYNPYEEHNEKVEKANQLLLLKEQEEKEEKERLKAEKKEKKKKKKKKKEGSEKKDKSEGKDKDKSESKKDKKKSTDPSAAAGSSSSSAAPSKEGEKPKKEVEKPKKPPQKDPAVIRRQKKNDKRRALRRIANADPPFERLKQGWEAPQRNRVIAAALRFGFGRFTKIRHESNLTSLPLQDVEVFIRSYMYQISLQVAVTLLTRLQKSGNQQQEFRLLIQEWIGPGSDAEVEWLCSSIRTVTEQHMQVFACRKFLRMPLILAEDSYLQSLRHGAAFRALRRIGILSRLNRIVEEGLDSILSVLGHEELAKRGCGTSDLSTLDSDLRARHVTTEELSLMTGTLYKTPISLSAPAAWWNRNCDIGLIIGTFVHGLGGYEAMRNDEDLPFIHSIRKYIESDEACCSAYSSFQAAASATRKVFDVALEDTKTKAALEIQAAVAAAAAAASEREKDALALRQGGAAKSAVLSNMPVVAAKKDDIRPADSRYVTLPRLKRAIVDAIRKTDSEVVTQVVVAAEETQPSGKSEAEKKTPAAATAVEVVPDSVVNATVVTLPMPDSRVLDRRLLELLNRIESTLDHTDPNYDVQEPGLHWEAPANVKANSAIRKKALATLYRSDDVVTNLISEYSGIGINGTQCASPHRSLDDGADYSIGAASTELYHIAHGTEAPRYLRAIGVPMNLTRFAITALAHADASTIDGMIAMENRRSAEQLEQNESTLTTPKPAVKNDKADKKKSEKSDAAGASKDDKPAGEVKSDAAGEKNEAEKKETTPVDSTASEQKDEANLGKEDKDKDNEIPASFQNNPNLRAAVCSAVLLFGFPSDTSSQTVDLPLWRYTREQSGAFDDEDPPTLFNMDTFLSHVESLVGSDAELPDAGTVRSYVENFLLPFCIRLCVGGNGPSIKNARGSKGKFETPLGVNEYQEPSNKVQSPLPDPCMAPEEQSMEAVGYSLAILRRVRLMRSALHIAAGEDVAVDRLVESSKSLAMCKNLDDVPLWWCPWVHDVALLVSAASNGLFSVIRDRTDDSSSSSSTFTRQTVVQSMYSTFVADEKALPMVIVERSAPEDVNEWIEQNAEEFPTANTLERRLAFLCTEATSGLDGEIRYDNLPMFDHGGWPRL